MKETPSWADGRALPAWAAILPPIAAFALQWAVWEPFHPYAWAFFFPAVFVSAWIGGFRYGVIATLLSAALVWWFFVPPAYSVVKGGLQFIPAATFLASGLLFSSLHQTMRHASERLRRDLEHRKRLEESLQRSHADLNRAQTVATIGSWRLDVRRNQLAWSDETYRIFGVPLGKPMSYDTFLACVHPEDRAHVDRAWRAALEGAPFDVEHRIVADGLVKWVREKADLELDEHGTLLGGVGITQDITARKRLEDEQRCAQQAIRESQQRLELALAGANLAAWDWRIDTGDVVYSERWGQVRGLRPEEVEPRIETWLAGIHPEDRPRLDGLLADYLEGRSAEYAAEYRVRKGSEHWLWMFDLGKVVERDDRGRPTRMVGVELDITERKRLEEELRIAEAKSSGIVSISADAIISIDEHQNITLFNEGAETIFGYSRREAIGAPLELLIPERYRATHGHHVEKFAAGAETSRRMGERGAAIFGLRKSGEEFPADAAISKLEVDGTRILTVALRDVTEEKRHEREQAFLAEIGAVLASTLDYDETIESVAKLIAGELAELCIVETVEDRGQVKRFAVTHSDPNQPDGARALQRYRLDRNRPYVGSSVFQTGQPLWMPEVTMAQLDPLAQSEEHRRIWAAIGPRSVMALPLITHGRLLGSIVLVRTQADRPYTEHDLRFAGKVALRAALAVENAHLYSAARRAIEARDEVLGVVAHDLRNPLSTILMQASLLEGEPDRGPRRPAAVIERAAKRMSRLIQDLLDVSSIEGGGLSVEPSRVSARRAVLECRETQEQLAAAAGLTLHVELAPDLPDVLADPGRLLQVFENLVGNALKFTEPGGRVSVGAAPRDDEVTFWVRDTGSGIPLEEVPRVFDRFWQARKAGRRGAGLGLTIVKGIVEAHRGRIWLESAPGRGTTVFFTLPAAPRAQAQRPMHVPHRP